MNNPNYYAFTDKQKLFFQRHQMTFNAAVQSGIQMICTDNDMEGQWQMAQDGKGLIRIDNQAMPAPAVVEDEQIVNGSVTH